MMLTPIILATIEFVDVLIAFDSSAVNWLVANDRGTPEAYAARQVERWNGVLSTTELDQAFKFRLAGTVTVDEDASAVDMPTILAGRLVNNYGKVVAKGEWKKVTDGRETFGADIVSVMIANGGLGNVGQGFSMDGNPSTFSDFAYSVVSIEAADVSFAQLHEIGHNMGCGHPWELKGDVTHPNDRFSPSSAGIYFTEGDEYFYTVMGYNIDDVSGAGRTASPYPAFSSARHTTAAGTPLGDLIHDNTSTLLSTYSTVAAFRSRGTGDPEPDPEPDPQPVAEDPFNPGKAAVWNFALDSQSGGVAGVLQLKIGKASKKGVSKVSAVITGLDGKKTTVKAQSLKTGGHPEFVGTAKGFGGVSLVLTGSGATGTVGEFSLSAAVIGGEIFNPGAAFRLGGRFEVDGVVDEFLPDGEPVSMNGRKWVCAKAAAIAYKKPKGEMQKRFVVNNDKLDSPKTNRSGLKLTYTPKTGFFKGSFTVYALVGDRMKKLKAAATGIVSDGIATGIATIRGVAPVPVRID